MPLAEVLHLLSLASIIERLGDHDPDAWISWLTRVKSFQNSWGAIRQLVLISHPAFSPNPYFP